MAREYAAIKVAIWQDDDFRAYSPAAQHLYFVLTTSPDVSFCGVLDWRPRRLLPRAAGWTEDALRDAAVELTEGRLIIIDEGTEECLIRSFLRHDGVMQHNKMCVSAMIAFGEIASNTIRGVIVHELHRLQKDFPEWPAWDREQVREVMKRNALDPSLAPSLAPAVAPSLAPAVAPSLAPADGAGLAPAVAPSLHQHQHQAPSTITTTAAAPDGAGAPGRRKPERPLPENWQPNEKHAETAATRSLDLAFEAEQFRNWHQAHDTRYRDWDAAFRTWLGKANAPRVRRAEPEPVSEWDRIVARADAERARYEAELAADGGAR